MRGKMGPESIAELYRSEMLGVKEILPPGVG
jgi:hypothetical protein